MNIKYKVNSENEITILTEETEIERKEKYTSTTEEILSLENTKTLLETKINNLKNNLIEIQEENTDNKNNLITLLLILICCVIVSLLSTKTLFLTKIISDLGIVFSILSIIVNTKKYLKNKKEINIQEKRINEEINRKDRVNKRIEVLSKSKTISIPKKLNEYIEIKPIYDFRFTLTDYFIENYQIEKRIKEMTKGKKKVKKRTNEFNNEEYKF